MKYIWRNGARIGVDANVAGVVLTAMAEENGMLTPQSLVDESRPVEAPLHPAFEWEDPRAAELYREHQARHIIRSIMIVRADDEEKSEPIHVFINVVRDEQESAYVTIQAAMSDDVLRLQVLERALGELKAFQKKYRQIKELAKVFEAINSVILEERRGN